MELKKQSKGTGRFKKILGILALLLVISLLVTSYFIGKQVVAGSTQLVTNEKTSKISNKKWIEKKFLPKYTVETFKLTSSFDGHMVPGDFIYPKGQDKNRDTIIMVHGLGGNRYSNYQVAEFFLQNGYNVITYDQRSSNENTAKKTAFGYWEKFDLIDCIDYAKEITNGKDIGVWGRSFGGATAVQAIAYKDTQDKVKWMILDCPVSSMKWMIEETINNMGMIIPTGYMVWCGNIVNKMELGFSYEDADSAKAAKSVHIPTLVINSKADEVTPYFMGKDIYDNLNCKEKEIWTVEDSEHIGMWKDYNSEYKNHVMKLITENIG